MVATGAAVCALYMNCTVPIGDCTFRFGRLGADGLLAPLSALPRLNAGTDSLRSGLKASSGSTLYLPSASSNGTGCCNPNVLTLIDLASGSEHQTVLVPPPELKERCGKYGCGFFQVAWDEANTTFPLVAWLQPNSSPPPPGVTQPARTATTETDPVVQLDPVTGLSELVRDITTIPTGQLAAKGQGLGAFDMRSQTLYFPGSASDMVDNRVFSISVAGGAKGAPEITSGPPKLDVNGMEFSAGKSKFTARIFSDRFPTDCLRLQ